MSEVVIISFLIFVAAMLYSSVGHGGASGYLAVMALFSIAPATMRPTALVLNICVSSIAAYKFASEGHFVWRKFYPFAFASVPFAFLGGSLSLPTPFFKPIVGVVLLVAALILMRRERNLVGLETVDEKAFSLPFALLCGAGLGLLSGLTGVGGGIFLSPLMLLLKWTDVRQTAAISALFILLNSVAGLSGSLRSSGFEAFPPLIMLCAFGAAAILGGKIGSTIGTNRAHSSMILRRILTVVLVVAGVKLLLE